MALQVTLSATGSTRARTGPGRRRRAARSRRLRLPLIATLVVLVVAAASTPAARGATNPVAITVATQNGRGRLVTPGRPCDDGGTGAYWHYEYDAALAPGVFSGLAAEALVHLDLHSDTQDVQNVDGVYPDGTNPTAFLQGEESHASLLNDRGSVKLRLSSGSCESPTLAFDGSHASGPGRWRVESGTGAYRDLTGDGTFQLRDAEVNPGADNALSLQLNGAFDLPIPTLAVEVVKTYWDSLGTDYLSRRVSVTYRITNTGPGDAFHAVLTSISNPTQGVTPIGNGPIALGDLPAGQFAHVTFRHQFSLLNGPCALVILGCNFQSTLNVDLPDAFDVSHPQSATVGAQAPLLPPPL